MKRWIGLALLLLLGTGALALDGARTSAEVFVSQLGQRLNADEPYLPVRVQQAGSGAETQEAAALQRVYLPYLARVFPSRYTFRIGVRVVNGTGEFYDRATGARFVPRGSNYVRLAPMPGAPGNLWHCILNPGFYDAPRAEAALRQMHSDGYNVVRVFVDCCRTGNNVGDPAGGLSSAYLDNMVDFLQRARANGIFVQLSLDLTPADGGYNEIREQCCSVFDGENLRYLTAGGIEAKRRYDQDFVRALKDRNAPLDAIFAFDLTNEVAFSADRPPLTLSSGWVTTANGQIYEMAKSQDKQRMLDEGLVYWIDQQRAAIREIDPTALVSVSFFQPQEPNRTRIGDPRLAVTRPAIWQSQADFVDLHAYPGLELTLPQYVENYGLQGMLAKPVIMGEFGAFRDPYPSVSSAAQALLDWQVTSCAYGFDGWLLWTWDCDEQLELWNALSEDGTTNNALAPRTRPDPCQPGAFSGQNAARGKPATASRSLPTNPPAMAVDGRFDNWWGAGAFAPQWIEIDLQASYTVAKIAWRRVRVQPGPRFTVCWAGRKGARIACFASSLASRRATRCWSTHPRRPGRTSAMSKWRRYPAPPGFPGARLRSSWPASRVLTT